MARMLWVDDNYRWVFLSGKHADEFLVDVAKEDPLYLEWLCEEDWLYRPDRENIRKALKKAEENR